MVNYSLKKYKISCEETIILSCYNPKKTSWRLQNSPKLGKEIQKKLKLNIDTSRTKKKPKLNIDTSKTSDNMLFCEDNGHQVKQIIDHANVPDMQECVACLAWP